MGENTITTDRKDLPLSEDMPSEAQPSPDLSGKEAASIIVRDVDSHSEDADNEDVVIITGEDAALHLLPMRDDGDASLTFRSIVLATALSGFQATMTQIYTFKPTEVTISGTFIVLLAYFLGKGWAALFPRGDLHEARWRAGGGTGKRPFWITFLVFLNPGAWSIKEHGIAAITATAASNSSASVLVFTAQKLFYDLPLSPVTIILSVISIGLFGYGLCGLFRPITVWHVEAVYWSTIPSVKTLQGLHWQNVKDSKPMRWFWYSFVGMFGYEFLPAYIFPWLNSVSIPCLAASHATGDKAATLTNLFGGALSNEGLGLFSLSFDWQYITSTATSLPLTLQANMAFGYGVCFLAMLGIYYSDTWGARSMPFMSTQLRSADGSRYPVSKVFQGGILDHAALEKYGTPRLTGSFAYGLFMANAAIGALIAHCILFWGGDIIRAFKSARKGVSNDRHHEHMSKNYKEVPWWWYVFVLVLSFFLGMIVVVKENITLTAGSYVSAIILGCIIAPFSCILYSRFGDGIATNNLSKMIAGLVLPERPVGNMYYAAFSHNVISNTVNLSNDLKLGEYLKIPPRVMFLTQIWGTIFGGFVNYVVMVSIVTSNSALLTDGNGSASWSGATVQSYNTNAASWALAKYLYHPGMQYSTVPFGILIGAGFVVVHRVFVKFVPKIRGFSTSDLNLPQFFRYAGFIPYGSPQTCIIFSTIIAGFYMQFYLRNYKPRIFKDYAYLVTAAWDGGSLFALFILSFAVFGAGGKQIPFPSWFGNNVDGNYDHCPVSK